MLLLSLTGSTEGGKDWRKGNRERWCTTKPTAGSRGGKLEKDGDGGNKEREREGEIMIQIERQSKGQWKENVVFDHH